MIFELKNANILTPTGDTLFGSLCYDAESGRITSVGEPCRSADSSVDVGGRLLIPGLVDIHTHGRAGYDFNYADTEEMRIMAESYLHSGVTSLMPTLASAEYKALLTACDRIKAAASDANGASFVGTHLEGRYLNPQKRGAHNISLLALPNAEEIEEIILHMYGHPHISAAFELDSDGSFADKALSMGATLALAHTCATYDEARAAEKNGVSIYSHLMNAMPPLHHRDGGAVCAALTGDKYCELICDGVHISPEVARLIYKCTGTERLVLVTDSMEATGCPDGNYTIAGMPVTVKNGRALTSDGALAGSTLSLLDAAINLSHFCEIPFEKAVLSATATPSRAIDMYGEIGSLEVGKLADIVVLGERYSIDGVIHKGRSKWKIWTEMI